MKTLRNSDFVIPSREEVRREGEFYAQGSSWLGPRNYLRAKRAADIVLALAAIIMFAPLFLVVSLMILFTEGRPIFFRQRRIGYHGKEIRIIKFRTMRRNAEEILRSDPALWAEYQLNYKLVNDPRVTKLGNFLRQTSLDELPQLFNVLLGDMSLVGPRPIVPSELALYGDHQSAYLSTIPGCTGLWVCSGRSDTTYEERVSLDMLYAGKASMRTDFCLLARTVLVVLNRKGAR